MYTQAILLEIFLLSCETKHIGWKASAQSYCSVTTVQKIAVPSAQVVWSLHRREIEMKECVAYGQVAESEVAVHNDTEEGIYENP